MIPSIEKTNHAQRRSQQRGVPPLIERWLDQYGEDEYDGHGGCRIYFSKRSVRQMERDFGRAPIRKMAEWLNVYKVESSRDGRIITIGRLYQHIRRK